MTTARSVFISILFVTQWAFIHPFIVRSMALGWGVARSSLVSPSPISSHLKSTALESSDPDVYNIIRKEYRRQVEGIELIASENFVSEAVLEALGSCFTNKYSEGLPKARYYGGNKNIDEMEILCQQRALSLYRLDDNQWGVNVQPYSGSPANFAVYTALLKPHDRIMGLDLPSGGHLTHGYQTAKRKVSATSIYFESLPYRVHPVTGLIDYDHMQQLVELFKPRLLIAGASAYPRDWDYAKMRKIADSVGALLMADMAHISGLVAAQEANNPFDHCDVVTTTTHKSLRGPRSGMIFARTSHMDAINAAVFPALQGGPHNHQIAALAVALKEAQTETFTKYIQQVKSNAKSLARVLQDTYGYKMVTGGTDNHLVLWDLREVSVTGDKPHHTADEKFVAMSGAKLEKLLEAVEISVNKNSLAGDTSAINPGGVRLGTPAMTTRGMVGADMETIAGLLHRGVQVVQSIHRHYGQQLKLKDFAEILHQLETNTLDNAAVSQDFVTLRRDVIAYASRFPMPGKAIG